MHSTSLLGLLKEFRGQNLKWELLTLVRSSFWHRTCYLMYLLLFSNCNHYIVAMLVCMWLVTKKNCSYFIEGISLGIFGHFGSFPICIHGSFDEIFVHDSDQGVIFIETQLFKKWFSDLIDITHYNRWKEYFWQRYSVVQCSLHSTVQGSP